MDDVGKFLGAGLIIAIIIVVMLGVAGLWTMLLWNWLMPIIFNLPQITFWQSIGVWLLSATLFGGRSIKYSKE